MLIIGNVVLCGFVFLAGFGLGRPLPLERWRLGSVVLELFVKGGIANKHDNLTWLWSHIGESWRRGNQGWRDCVIVISVILAEGAEGSEGVGLADDHTTPWKCRCVAE